MAYEKFADGRLKCKGVITYTGACTSAWGSMFETVKVPFLPFPIPFTQMEHISYTSTGAASFIQVDDVPAGATELTNPRSICFARPSSLASGTFKARYEATGLWK